VVFENLLLEMESYGYEVQTLIIPACAVNAPHRRDRVWIVANAGCKHGTGAEVGRELERQIFSQEDASMFERSNGNGREGNAPDTEKPECEPSRGTRARGEGFADGSEFIADTEGREAQSAEPRGFHAELGGKNRAWDEPWLEVATRLCRVDDGLPRRMDRTNRLKTLGNAIVPWVVYPIMKAIKEIEEREP
jgi:DNA (cytosine-5)-methyltransferase 1